MANSLQDRQLRTLIVEDNRTDRILLESMFASSFPGEFETKNSDTLAGALSLLEHGGFDIILLDLNLPDSNNIETLFEVDKKCPSVPIIVVTSANDEKLGISALRSGAQDYIVKGQFDAKLLYKSMQYAIERKKNETEIRMMYEKLKMAQESLERNERKFRSLFESSRDGIFFTGTTGNIFDINEAGAHLLGGHKDGLLENNMGNFFLGRATFKNMLQKLNKTGYIKNHELKLCRADRSEISCLLSASCQRDETGKSIAYQIIVRDISRIKKMQEELLRSEKLAMMGTMAASVAHELRNPIGAMRLAVDNMARRYKEKEYDKLSSHIQNIAKKVDESNKIINDILSYTKLSTPTRSEIDLHMIMDESLSMALYKYPAKKITVTKNYGELPSVMADPVQIGEVFNNVVNNAYESMENTGRLTVDTSAVLHHKKVRISVTDTGYGMTEDTVKNMMKPFFSTKAKGIGLGMAISHRIIKENHKGNILVESEPDKGTKITVELPIK
jgi:PAS domain S-box-containing protein